MHIQCKQFWHEQIWYWSLTHDCIFTSWWSIELRWFHHWSHRKHWYGMNSQWLYCSMFVPLIHNGVISSRISADILCRETTLPATYILWKTTFTWPQLIHLCLFKCDTTNHHQCLPLARNKGRIHHTNNTPMTLNGMCDGVIVCCP